jgi:hypothetical protein
MLWIDHYLCIPASLNTREALIRKGITRKKEGESEREKEKASTEPVLIIKSIDHHCAPS